MNCLKIVLLLIVFSSCQSKHQDEVRKNEYSKLFSLDYTKAKRTLTTLDEKGTRMSSVSFPEDSIPKRIVLLNTTHCSYVKTLGLQGLLKGIASFESLKSDASFQNKGIVNVGEKAVIDLEKIQAIQPDLVICSSFQEKDLGVLTCPVLVINEFWEEHPLARLEWLKAFGLIANQQSKADSIFNRLVADYQTNLPVNYGDLAIMNLQFYNSHFFTPSCRALINQLLTDAGYSVFCEGEGSKSQELSKEKVLVATKQLDVLVYFDWSEQNASYEKIVEDLNIKENFQGSIIYCNTFLSPYFEESIVEPHLVVSELSAVVKNKNFKGKYFSLLTKRK